MMRYLDTTVSSGTLPAGQYSTGKTWMEVEGMGKTRGEQFVDGRHPVATALVVEIEACSQRSYSART